jgi:phosphosulfolactate synthase (CoM biosynthesis protein A)
MQLKGKELLEYQRYIEKRRDEKSFATTKELELQEAREKGKEEGKKEGEKKAKIEIAKNILDILDIDTIFLKTPK